MRFLYLRDFMEKYKLGNASINESELPRAYKYHIYPRDSRLYSDKEFINKDNGSQGGSHWTCFIIKDSKSYYFDSFGGALDKLLLKQLPMSIIYQNYKIQDVISKICGSYCLYFF